MRNKKSSELEKELALEIRAGGMIEGDRRQYVYVGAKPRNGAVTIIWLPASYATDAGKIVSTLLDAGLAFNDPLLIKRTVSDALKKVQTVPAQAAVRSGWHGRQFVFDGKIFGKDSSPELFVHQDLAKTHSTVATTRNDDLIKFLNKAGRQSDFIVVATLIAFAQPLIGMHQSSERPVFYIWGETRTGKTTIAKFINALSRPPGDQGLHSFAATDRAFEEMLQQYSDSVAVFDELKEDNDTEIVRKLSPFIYMAANGRGKSRSKGANFPNLRWRTTTVVTGEKNLSQFRAKHRGSGQDARFIVLPVPDGESGGIWTSPIPQEKRDKKMRSLERHCTTYWNEPLGLDQRGASN